MVVLPLFPKAYANDNLVIIEYEDGRTYVWGREITSETARLVAEQMDVELKLLAYIQETAGIFLNIIYDSVSSIADDSVISELMSDVLFHWVRQRTYS